MFVVVHRFLVAVVVVVVLVMIDVTVVAVGGEWGIVEDGPGGCGRE